MPGRRRAPTPRTRLIGPAARPAAETPVSLAAVREIAHAFITAERPEEVLQYALDRTGPVLGAAFASVYLVEPASDLMRLAAAWNWPAKFRPWLGEMRVRVGNGPSGEAVSERRAIEVPDVLADARLADWADVARELGFRGLVAVPLESGQGVLGAAAFYFAEAGALPPERRALARLVADQMAAAAEKSAMIADLRRTNAALHEANAELERQYEALSEARRLKEEFLANVSHELRTPLAAALRYVALLQQETSGPLTVDQREDLAQVQGSAERLLGLIDDLLLLTAAKRGELPLDIGPADLAATVREVLAAVGGRGAEVALIDDVPRTAVPATTDHRLVSKIVAALVGNAYKFTSQGEVRVSLAVRGARARIGVHDTGAGIPRPDLERVFEEFRRLDDAAAPRFGGAGLGLALARRLAR
ncbi:MAG: GAF domain-containing sensor histidine kinase, partial [Gemmatimonadaceae bacterium]|nr:GAF domain-containing sensor histidine kinase [Gemmatimonadaceae bacterium]